MIAVPAAAGIDTSAVRDGHARWLAVMTHTDPRYGGLSAAVPQGEREAAREGRFEVALAAFCAPGEHYRPAGYGDADLSFWPLSRKAWLRSAALRRQFTRQVEAADGVHLHGLWEASTAIGARAAKLARKPYVLSAHGMLEPWALANKRLKKALYAALLERGIVARARCLHALTRAEAAQYRAFGAKQPIAVVPNAVTIPRELSPAAFWERFPQLEGRRLLLYLGRLHPKKGLDLLSAAWAEIAPTHPDWHLVLAGPDAEGTEAGIRARLASSELRNTFTFTGMLGPALKWSALAAAEVFTLPSYSEGLSMGVLEALGASLPVVITRQCNLPEAATASAGWEVDANQASLTAALTEALANNQKTNRARGLQGHYLVTSRYDPRVIAGQLSEVYRYALHGILPTTTPLFTD